MPRIDAFSKEVLSGNHDRRVTIVDTLVDNPATYFPLGIIVYDKNTRAFYEVQPSGFVELPSIAYQYESVTDLPVSSADGTFAFVRDEGALYAFSGGTWAEFVSSSSTGIPISQRGTAGGVATLDGATKVVQRLSYEGEINGVATLNAAALLTAAQDPSNLFNVKSYGAVGDGVTNDYAAIQAAIEAAHAAGGGRVYVPAVDVEGGGYYRLGSNKPLYARNNVHIFGDGPNSLLFNDKPTPESGSNPWMSQAVILFGNHNARSMTETVYRVLDAIPAGGTDVVTLATPAEAANYSVGDLVFIVTNEHWTYNVIFTPRHKCPHETFITEVVAVNVGTGAVTLRHGVPVGMANPRIGNSAERQVGSQFLDGFLGEPFFVVKRASIQNLGIKSYRQWSGNGAMLECLWRDLWIESSNGLYSNGFAHTLVENIWVKFTNKLVETAIGSYNSVLRNIHGERTSDVTPQTSSTSWIKIGENARGIRIDATVNNREGAPMTSTIVRVGHATDCHVNVDATAPGITGSAVAFVIRDHDGDNTKATEGCSVTGTFRMGTLDRFLAVSDARTEPITPDPDPEDPHDPETPDPPAVGTGDGTVFVNNTFRINATGTATAAAARIVGIGTDISGSRFGSGSIHYTAASDGCIALDTHAPEGFKASLMTPAMFAANPLHRLITTRSKALAELTKTTTAGTIDVNSTTVDNEVDSLVIPAGSLSAGDELRVVVQGRITGTNGIKDVRLHIAETAEDFAMLNWGAANINAFHLDARMYFRTTGFHNATAVQTLGADLTAKNTFGTLNTETSPVTLSFRAWVANALDTVRVDRVTWSIERGAYS